MKLPGAILLTALGACLLTSTGCQSAKPQARQSGAQAKGNVDLAAAVQRGLTVADLTGGDLGIGGGFLIGAAPDKIRLHEHQQALAAAQAAEQSPARLQQVRESTTADLNGDGFVTMDEVLAMVRAGLSEDDVIARLKKTGYQFQVTPQQERFLSDRLVPAKVIAALHEMGTTSVAIAPY
jgi:hypothetical protein